MSDTIDDVEHTGNSNGAESPSASVSMQTNANTNSNKEHKHKGEPSDSSDHLQYLLTAYLFDSLSAAGRAEVESHLAKCEQCREQLEALRETLGEVEEVLQTKAETYVFEVRRRRRVLDAAKKEQFRILPRVDWGSSFRFPWKLHSTSMLIAGVTLCALTWLLFSQTAEQYGMKKSVGGTSTSYLNPQSAPEWKSEAGASDGHYSYSEGADSDDEGAEAEEDEEKSKPMVTKAMDGSMSVVVPDSEKTDYRMEKRRSKPNRSARNGTKRRFSTRESRSDGKMNLNDAKATTPKNSSTRLPATRKNPYVDYYGKRLTRKPPAQKKNIQTPDTDIDDTGLDGAFVRNGKEKLNSEDRKSVHPRIQFAATPKNSDKDYFKKETVFDLQITPPSTTAGKIKEAATGGKSQTFLGIHDGNLKPMAPPKISRMPTDGRLYLVKPNVLHKRGQMNNLERRQPRPSKSGRYQGPPQSATEGKETFKGLSSEHLTLPPTRQKIIVREIELFSDSKLDNKALKKLSKRLYSEPSKPGRKNKPNNDNGTISRSEFALSGKDTLIRREAAKLEIAQVQERLHKLENGKQILLLGDLDESNANPLKERGESTIEKWGSLNEELVRDKSRKTEELRRLKNVLLKQQAVNVPNDPAINGQPTSGQVPFPGFTNGPDKLLNGSFSQVGTIVNHSIKYGKKKSGNKSKQVALNKFWKDAETSVGQTGWESKGFGWDSQPNAGMHRIQLGSMGFGMDLKALSNTNQLGQTQYAGNMPPVMEAATYSYPAPHGPTDSYSATHATTESIVRAYNHFNARSPNLALHDFILRPRPVPPPELTDEGLGEDEFLKRYNTRPFVDAASDNLSTFAMDVDTSSYTLARSRLKQGQLPDPASVRVEEFVNNFKQTYAIESDNKEAFSVFAEAGPAPFAGRPDVELLKIGIKSRDPRPDERRPAMITLAIDSSGSMSKDGRLSLVQEALNGLVQQLRPEDAVCIVSFGGLGELVLPRTQASQKQKILDAIARLTPNGGTNVESGLNLAYRLADEAYSPDAVNRVILCSDGVANVGAKGPDAILKRVKVFAARGIDLITVGFGKGNYDDKMMERLANNGNGSSYFVDSIQEAKRVFTEQLPPHLNVLARDAKVQVEFNRDVVDRYRLLGYENRKIADKDFRNDKIDGSEVPHSTLVTVLYEIKRKPHAHGPYGKIFLRWKDAGYRRLPVVERNYPLSEGILAGSWSASSPNLRFLACVAEFAELLRGSRWARDGSFHAVLWRLYSLPATFCNGNAQWAEVVELVKTAQRLSIKKWKREISARELLGK